MTIRIVFQFIANGRISIATVALGLLFTWAVSGQPPSVVVFEQPHFGGRSAALSAGDHSLVDWKPSSIRVSPGFVAILYESTGARGGYGVSVDLLEDHPDFTAFGLNARVSFVTVFRREQEHYHWERNRLSQGEFIVGHWERNRAAGNAVNSVAVASPPLREQSSAASFTHFIRRGSTWIITTLGLRTDADATLWTRAQTVMGVIGSDFRGPQEIGSAAFQRASNNAAIPDWLNFWYPLKQSTDSTYFKRTLTGVIADTIKKNWTVTIPTASGKTTTVSGQYSLSTAPHVVKIGGTYEDYDLNVDVIPFARANYLITDAHKPEKSTKKQLKDIVDSDHDPCTDPFIKVEAEVDARAETKQRLAKSLQQRIGKEIAIYGPWIYDEAHCYHPEIHPAEEIWWAENLGDRGRKYHLNVFCDSSRRFWWRSQMDDGTKLKPWGAPPITGLFAIAFEVPISSIRTPVVTGQRFDVANVDTRNITSVTNSDKVYDLVFQGTTLVSFVPHNNAFKVSFEHVHLNPGANPATSDTVRGFLVLETTVGTVKQIATRVQRVIPGSPTSVIWVDVPAGSDPDKIDQSLERAVFEKKAGHYMFTITRTEMGGQALRHQDR